MEDFLTIAPATSAQCESCCDILINSSIGLVYFNDKQYTEKFILEGIEKKELFVGLTADGNVAGFIWFALHGTFYRFPYLRTLAVKSKYRGKGVGKKLLDYYEKNGFESASQIFLLVSDFNSTAQRFYEKAGFKKIGEIPEFNGSKVTEMIYMKTKILL